MWIIISYADNKICQLIHNAESWLVDWLQMKMKMRTRIRICHHGDDHGEDKYYHDVDDDDDDSD